MSAHASASPGSVPGNTDWFYSESGQRNWVGAPHFCRATRSCSGSDRGQRFMFLLQLSSLVTAMNGTAW